jgi:Fe-S-cluster containining protein
MGAIESLRRGPIQDASVEICTTQCGACCCKGPRRVMTTQREAVHSRSLNHRVIIGTNGRGEWCMALTQEHCVFLNEVNKCSIYDVRPQACRNFPTRPYVDCLLWPK